MQVGGTCEEANNGPPICCAASLHTIPFQCKLQSLMLDFGISLLQFFVMSVGRLLV